MTPREQEGTDAMGGWRPWTQGRHPLDRSTNPRPLTASEQARADAMADAETLRRFCDENIYSTDFPMFSSYPLIAIWKCGNSGWTVRSINRGREFDAWSRAEGQAHAAFRAVPGLRGEQ